MDVMKQLRAVFKRISAGRVFEFIALLQIITGSGAVIIAFDLGKSTHLLAVSSISAVVFLAIIVLLCSVVMLVFARYQSADIVSAVTKVRQQIADGSPDIEVEPDRGDEIGGIIAALNDLGRAYRGTMQRVLRAAEELAVVELLASTINRTLDLQQVLDTSLREALNAIKWDRGSIYMWDNRSGNLNMVSFIGMTEESVRESISYGLGESIIGQAAQSREMIIVSDNPAGASENLSRIVIPLVSTPGELVGVMEVGNSHGKPASSDVLNLLRMVSTHISLAIDKAQLYSKVTEHAEELEKLVGARTEQLSQAIDELWVALKEAREADRIKSLLLSTVSHELRTPLATIKGSASVLIEHLDQLSRDQLKEHLVDIEEESDKLAELITNLLDMSRLEAGTLQIQKGALELGSVLTNAVTTARLRHRDHQISLSLPENDMLVTGDGRRIEQVLSNLLDNAAKYSEPSTSVHVQVTAGDSEYVVAVSDHGRGIPSEHLNRIFDRFYQVDSTGDSGRTGVGLGLSICKGLIEAHDGRIWAESVPGQGATFSFSLRKYQTEEGQS